MPTYNNLRRAFGLAAKTSFTAITGEATDSFPSDPQITKDPLNDPNILDFTELRDASGVVIPLNSDEAREEAVTGIRRTTLAARLKGIYGDVNQLDAFTGMLAERHVPGTEFGELQLAICRRQFRALRDGDRFFYLNDPLLTLVRTAYGVSYRHTLAELIRLNTGATVQSNVFQAP
jgi:hypothetical protein